MAYLVISLGGEEVLRRELRGPVVIGRSLDADVSVRDASLSRAHCRIEPTGNPREQTWQVTDLGSRNGTTVNGRRVSSHGLHHGDLLRVGRVTVYFSTEAFKPADMIPGIDPSEPRQVSPELSGPDARERVLRPLLVPETRLPRPLPGEVAVRKLNESVDVLSSPGWSRQLRAMPSPSIDEASLRSATLDIGSQDTKTTPASKPSLWASLKTWFSR